MHEFLLSQTNMWPISSVVTPSTSISASHSRKAPFIAQRDLLKVLSKQMIPRPELQIATNCVSLWLMRLMSDAEGGRFESMFTMSDVVGGNV